MALRLDGTIAADSAMSALRTLHSEGKVIQPRFHPLRHAVTEGQLDSFSRPERF
jgi:hypothetical protein